MESTITSLKELEKLKKQETEKKDKDLQTNRFQSPVSNKLFDNFNLNQGLETVGNTLTGIFGKKQPVTNNYIVQNEDKDKDKDKEKGKDKTMLYVGIGGGVLMLVILLIVMLK